MIKRTLVKLFLVFAILLSLGVSVASAVPPAQEELTYTVKLGDNLWTLAEKYLGSGPAYWAIFSATNAESEEDSSFASIEDPGLIHPGWKLLIPSAEEAAAEVAPPPVEKTLRVHLNADISTLDPAPMRASAEQQLASNIYSGLTRFKAGTTEIEPDVAGSWEWSPDAKKITFKLREGVQFHGGYGELTADDVKFTYERHMDPEVATRYRQDFAIVESINVVDDYTLEIVFNEPALGFISNVTAYRPGYLLSRKAVEERGEDYGLNPIGTGSYEFVEYEKSTHVILKRFDDYFGDMPAISEVVFVPIPEAAVAFSAVLAGDIDVMDTRSAEVFNAAKGRDDVNTMAKPAMSVRSVHLNVTKPGLEDQRVRQALRYAIDLPAIVEEVLGGSGQVAWSVLNPNHRFYTDDVKEYPYDPDRARELLAEAGFGEGLALQFVYPIQEPYSSIAPAVQAYWQEVGLDVELVAMERTAWNERAASGAYDVTIMGLTRPPDPDLYLTQGYHSANQPPGSTYSYYSAADDMIEQAGTETDEEKRAALYKEIQQQIAEDSPSIPIYYPNNMSILKPGVKGYAPGVLNEMWLHVIDIEK
jgi:peptide/nickel transport system substrate-binding protein